MDLSPALTDSTARGEAPSDPRRPPRPGSPRPPGKVRGARCLRFSGPTTRSQARLCGPDSGLAWGYQGFPPRYSLGPLAQLPVRQAAATAAAAPPSWQQRRSSATETECSPSQSGLAARLPARPLQVGGLRSGSACSEIREDHLTEVYPVEPGSILHFLPPFLSVRSTLFIKWRFQRQGRFY